jgi:type II secretory pathway component GspD/PulD (secretin)
LGSDPDSIADDEEIVTHIIPVRFVEATQLLKDLQPLVSVNTSMTANESGNSIVITATQSNIRRVGRGHQGHRPGGRGRDRGAGFPAHECRSDRDVRVVNQLVSR